jgi:hypothetical protein
MDYEYKIPAAGPIRLDDAVEQQVADAMTVALMGADDISLTRMKFVVWAEGVMEQMPAVMPAAIAERRRRQIVNIDRAALGFYAVKLAPVDLFGVHANGWIDFFSQHGATITEQDASARLVHAIVGVKGQ